MRGFHCVAKHIEGWLKIFTSFLVKNQILPWFTLFLHFPMNDHFSYKHKFLKKIVHNTIPCIHGSSPFQQMINPETQELHKDVRKV
jgi:hypothetical protein